MNIAAFGSVQFSSDLEIMIIFHCGALRGYLNG